MHSQKRLYSPLTRYVQNEIEARLSIGFSAKGSIVSLVKKLIKTEMALQLDTSSSLDGRSTDDYTSRNMQVAAFNVLPSVKSKRRYSSNCKVRGR